MLEALATILAQKVPLVTDSLQKSLAKVAILQDIQGT
jgi:hypothetical protein